MCVRISKHICTIQWTTTATQKKKIYLWQMRLSQLWVWKLLSSGTWCSVVWYICASILEKTVIYIFMVHECVCSNTSRYCCFLSFWPRTHFWGGDTHTADSVTHKDRLIIRTMIRAENLQLNMSYVRPCMFCISEVCPLVCVKVLVCGQKNLHTDLTRIRLETLRNAAHDSASRPVCVQRVSYIL